MDQDGCKMKYIPTKNPSGVVLHVHEEKASDECSEGSAIWERSSTFRCNSVSSWNSLQNEFTSTPYHNLPVRRGNELYGPHFDSFRCFSQSQTFLTKICDKEATFSVPCSLSNKRQIRQKTPSADNIYNSRSEVLLHFSPGTKASNTTMKKKLELLKRRNELRKTIIKKSSLSQHHFNLHEAEEKFLSSLPDVPNAVSGNEGNENSNTALRFLQHTAADIISDFPKPTNATYIVEPLVSEDQCEERDVDKQIVHLTALTSWLNYLLDENSGIDISNEVLGKGADLYLKKLLISGGDIPAAREIPSQNDISYKCFVAANELNEMRARFRLLYESSPIPNEIVTVVKDGKIAIRKDRRVYADVGLQTELLSLFLSFHPFYVQLGLETVLSINIERRNDFRSQLRIIASVVTRNVFKDPKIMNNRKYVQGKTKRLINDRGAEALRQHFLTKICLFLFTVDKGWRDNIVSRKNRCLFVKQSPYKSIKDVVAMLSRELMNGTSNLPKTLSRLGVCLDRKQGFFEEFRYHVTDELKDLSNGMIIGRTVEILANLQYGTVIHCLRDPGGDRLRKVGNVKTVIDFAKREGILPEDLYVDIDGVVQGNVNEIISLLWRFVCKGIIIESDNCDAEISAISQQLLSLFGISCEIRNPLELADGKLFALLWKQYFSYGRSFEFFSGRTVLERIINAAEYHFGIPSIMLMKWKSRPEAKSLCLFSKIFISHIYECHKFNSAALTIQRAFRRYRTTLKTNQDANTIHVSKSSAESCQITAEEDSQRANASIVIQKFIRRWRARAFYQRLLHEQCTRKRENAAVVLQNYIRGWLARLHYQKLRHEILCRREKAAVRLQKFIRGGLARASYRRLKHEQNTRKLKNAAIVIQSCVRGWLARLHYRKVKHEQFSRRHEKAAITLQRFIRGWLSRASYQRLLHKRNTKKREYSAITIQSNIRGWLARLRYRKLRHEISSYRREKAAVTLQRFIRCWLSRASYQRLLQERKTTKWENAAIVIQSFIRGCLARMYCRNLQYKISLHRREQAAVTLQRYTRGWIVRKNCRRMLHEVALHKQENAAIAFQDSISVVECPNDRFENKIYESQVISNAEYLRVLRELKKQHNRLRLRRQKYLQIVEDKMKFAVLLKTERDQRISAATKIQAWWRGYLLRKRYRARLIQITADRFARQEAASSEEWSERMQPIMNRVMNAMVNLNSVRLYTRYKATEVLQKFVGLSELCSQYVFNNGGLECILDSLDGCNRSVGSTEVVIPLCSILWSVLKFKNIRNQLDEERQMDILKQCYHFMLAFHNVPKVVTDLSAIIVALNGNSKQYKKAHFFVAELEKKFAKLSKCDERVTALRKLQSCLQN